MQRSAVFFQILLAPAGTIFSRTESKMISSMTRHIYIYIYIKRERERERERERVSWRKEWEVNLRKKRPRIEVRGRIFIIFKEDLLISIYRASNYLSVFFCVQLKYKSTHTLSHSHTHIYVCVWEREIERERERERERGEKWEKEDNEMKSN